jgi:hypothetical protein
MALKKVTEIPTIDVVMVTLKATIDSVVTEIALTTANKIAVSPQVETTDAVKLIIKSRLIAQKPQKQTLTGNTIVLTDNVFSPEVVKLLQGGTIKFDAVDTTKVIGYTPPVAGAVATLPTVELCAYSAQYDSTGAITQYEKITYPNCTGTPIAFSSEDGVFRAPEYTINSMPGDGVAAYDIDYVAVLPAVS